LWGGPLRPSSPGGCAGLDCRVDLRRRASTGRASCWLAKPGVALPDPAACLALPPLISSGAEVQVDAVALPLDFVDLALGIVLVLAGLTVDSPQDLDEGARSTAPTG
jgi:hypothetical protein